MTTTKPNDQSLPKSFTPVRQFQGIDEYVLDNGLKVLLFPDPSQANVTVNITYLVGSRHEGRGEAGMAHLLEHMLFRGTHAMRDVKGALQDKGAQFNATTWFDRTNYFETLTPTKENLDFALKLEADRMINSLILQEDLDAEMTVVRNEFEMGENNPVHVLHDQIMSSAYRWHNYGKTTIGNRSDIERVPVTTLRKFYEHYYQPDNAVLIVAGQFDIAYAMELIDRYFATIKKPARKMDETYTEEPAQDGPRELTLMRVGDMASAAVAYHIPAASHEDHAAIKVLFDCLTDEPGGIIYQKLVTTNRCSELFSMVYSLYEPGMALCFVRPTDDEQTTTVHADLIDLIESKAREHLDEQQVERIKMRALKRIKLSLTNSKDVALKLSEAIACGDWRLFFWHRDQIKEVTLAKVVHVLDRYIMASNRTAGIFKPIKDPKRAQISKAPNAADVVANIVDDASLSAGDVFLASCEAIEARVMRTELRAEQKAAVLMKKTRGQTVRAQLRFGFADEATLLPNCKEFWLMPALLWRGTNKYDYQGIRDRVDALMSSLDIDGYGGLMVASIKSEKNYLHDTIDMAVHMLRDSKFKAEEFEIVRQREIDNYEETKSDPQRLGFQELERLKNPWPKDSIHYVHTFDEIIEELGDLKLAPIQEVYDRMLNLNHASIGIVGECDMDGLQKHMRDLLAPTKMGVPYKRVPRPFIKNVVEEINLDCPDKEMAIVSLAFNFPLRDDHADYPALKLANYMFGENMNSRLMNRIREKEGISYGAGSSIDISRYEECASLSISAMAAPESVKRAKVAIDEEWQRFVERGVDDKELLAAKESIWLSFENLLANDGFLVGAFARDLEIGRDFFWREKLFARMKALSAQEIATAVQKWWGHAQFSRVTACDLKKIK